MRRVASILTMALVATTALVLIGREAAAAEPCSSAELVARGERCEALPTLTLDGERYTVYRLYDPAVYDPTGPDDAWLAKSALLSRFFDIQDPTGTWQSFGTTGLIVWDEGRGRPVSNEALVREILWAHVVRTRLGFDLSVRASDFGEAAKKIRESQEGLGGFIWESALAPESFLNAPAEAVGLTNPDVVVASLQATLMQGRPRRRSRALLSWLRARVAGAP